MSISTSTQTSSVLIFRFCNLPVVMHYLSDFTEVLRRYQQCARTSTVLHEKSVVFGVRELHQ
jgi:hypothetical protein